MSLSKRRRKTRTHSWLKHPKCVTVFLRSGQLTVGHVHLSMRGSDKTDIIHQELHVHQNNVNIDQETINNLI